MEITPDSLKRMRACTDLDMPSDAQIALLDHIDALQQQVTALAAENVSMLKLLTDISENYCESQTESEDSIAVIDLDYISEVNAYVSRDVNAENPFPATDAIQNEWMAKGVEMVADHIDRLDSKMMVSSNAIRSYAPVIRAGDKL